jgi:hypothetical protein
MKVSIEFATEQLTRARQIVTRRKLITPEMVGETTKLVIQGNGNMLSSRPAKIYNVNAVTMERAQAAYEALKTSTFNAAIADMDEQGVRDHVNEVLNNAQISFTVPISRDKGFSNGDIVVALVEEFSVEAKGERAAYTGIGLNNVSLAKSVAAKSASAIFNGWDRKDEDEATIEDATASGDEQVDAFADSALETEPVAESSEPTAPTA